jgi:pyridoxine 5-phosphate synthase
MKSKGVRVSFFIDPDPAQVQAAHAAGADMVEIHTGRYANAAGESQYEELKKIEEATQAAQAANLQINAGHGLDYDNVAPIARIPGMRELNIGFSIVARAIFVGLEQAVREMKKLVVGG